MDISLLPAVIPSEVTKLKSVNGVCATILDSSLRCAAFRMTSKGCFVRNDRMEMAGFRMLCVSIVNRT